MRQGSKVLSLTFPNDIIEFFENWAKEELEDHGEELNWVVLSKRRNELMIYCLNKVIEGEDE